jgi:hypothetical protein
MRIRVRPDPRTEKGRTTHETVNIYRYELEKNT